MRHPTSLHSISRSDTEAPTSERCPAGGEAKRLRHGLGHRSAPSARQPVPRRPWEHEHREGREGPAAGSAPSSKAAPSPPTAPDSQHPQAVEGAVVLVLPRPFVILEVFDILHHLDRKKPSFNGVSV